MFKITAIISLMLVATWSHADLRRNKKEGSSMGDIYAGSTLWAASLSCDSCGSECASACGTRHFRSCCFNYLRRKRGQESNRLWSHDMKVYNGQRPKMLPFFAEDPEPWSGYLSSEYKPYPIDDNVGNHLQLVYDV